MVFGVTKGYIYVMGIKINLSKKRLKSSFGDIRLILSEFQKLQNTNPSSFFVDLKKLQEYHKLPVLLIWIFLNKYKKLKCKKLLRTPSEDAVLEDLDKAHFFDKLTEKKSIFSKSDYPIHLESFSVLKNLNSNINNQINKIIANLAKFFFAI